MGGKIDRRDDVGPTEAERTYGEVGFADPVDKKCPVDTPGHGRAAWSRVHRNENAGTYDADGVRLTGARIKRAEKKHGVEFDIAQGGGERPVTLPLCPSAPRERVVGNDPGSTATRAVRAPPFRAIRRDTPFDRRSMAWGQGFAPNRRRFHGV